MPQTARNVVTQLTCFCNLASFCPSMIAQFSRSFVLCASTSRTSTEPTRTTQQQQRRQITHVLYMAVPAKSSQCIKYTAVHCRRRRHRRHSSVCHWNTFLRRLHLCIYVRTAVMLLLLCVRCLRNFNTREKKNVTACGDQLNGSS